MIIWWASLIAAKQRQKGPSTRHNTLPAEVDEQNGLEASWPVKAVGAALTNVDGHARRSHRTGQAKENECKAT